MIAMHVMLCRNRVENFSEWKAVFDSHSLVHRDAGLHLMSLWRDVEEPNNIFFLFEVADIEMARKFIGQPEAAEAGRASGVLDGEYYFLESVPEP